jgi:hypothetical protein
MSRAHESGACVAPAGGEAQATEVISDELKVSKASSFAEGESTARQMFTVGGDRDGR